MSAETPRSWGGTFTLSLAFPVAALVAAALVFATSAFEAGLVFGVIAALVPWALIAGDIRVPPWIMVVAGVGIPGAVAVVYEAAGANFLALLAVAWLAASGESLAAEVIAALGTIAIPIVSAVGDWDDEGEGVVYFGTGVLIVWFIGRIIRRERELVAALTEAQERLQLAATAAERQRIARDVHDVVGHSLTVMLLNVTGARRVLGSDPAAAAEALDRAEQAGRGSLQSVRAIVGLLRTPDDAGTQSPQPGAEDIVGLVDTAAAAGQPVRAEVLGDLRAVDPYTGLAAYRLVQEALANVEHHAPGSDVVVRVVVNGVRLSVSVRNGPARRPPPAPAGRGGTGLDGMHQRVAAVGGTVSAGPEGDGWVVEGSMPLERTEATVRPDGRT
jgi:signal transduction histidine kinase